MVFIFSFFNLNAQIEVKWEKDLKTNIQWQKITGLGNLIVKTDNGLHGINTDNGSTKWSLTNLKDITQKDLEELSTSSFLRVNFKEALYLIDQFSGKIVFNSTSKGLRILTFFSISLLLEFL